MWMIALFAISLIAPTAGASTRTMLGGHPLNFRAVATDQATADTTFSRWLAAYSRAWSGRDPNTMATLFALRATYREDPFGPATNGREAIRADWADIAKHQQDIHFDYQVLSTNEKRGIAHWTASFVRLPSKEVVQLDGILMVTFNASGQCTEFREWWHRRTLSGTKSGH